MTVIIFSIWFFIALCLSLTVAFDKELEKEERFDIFALLTFLFFMGSGATYLICYLLFMLFEFIKELL